MSLVAMVEQTLVEAAAVVHTSTRRTLAELVVLESL
jgi:hypothetical protein